jgi:hypothetical protein
MRERFDFVGPNITPKREAQATHDLASFERKSNLFQEGELPKTPEEIAAIEFFDGLLKMEFLDLGIPEIPELRPERFHIMSEAWCDANMEKSDHGAYFPIGNDTVLSRHRAKSRLDLYNSISHEAIHSVSKQKYWFDPEKNIIRLYRVGYKVENESGRENPHVHLRAFNEGVVEAIAEEFFTRNSQAIGKKLSIPERELEKCTFDYAAFRRVVKDLCHGIAQAQNSKPQDVWNKIKKGQFTGEMMHLRDIEYAYGKGALRILDALQVTSDDLDMQEGSSEQIDEKNEKILQFFGNYDRKEESRELVRMELAQGILGEEDFKKYCL